MAFRFLFMLYKVVTAVNSVIGLGLGKEKKNGIETSLMVMFTIAAILC